MHEIGVVIVSYNSGDVVLDCLESLLAAEAKGLRIVVVDNASPEDTLAILRNWASGAQPWSVPSDCPFDLVPRARPIRLRVAAPDAAPDPEAQVTVLASPENLGFAGGVNLGLAHLAQMPDVAHFWILNPDSMVPGASVHALARHLREEAGSYGLIGGRVNYYDRPGRIQIDGGTVNFGTGVTGNVGRSHRADAPAPNPRDFDFITGASMVASRAFYETVGPMREDYFLYYEEVDWAMRRGDMRLGYCPGLVVYHRAGTAIGSPKHGQVASPLSLYFKHRGRMRFLRRFKPTSLPLGYAYGLAKAGAELRRGRMDGARAILAALHGWPAPAAVRDRLSPQARIRAFARSWPEKRRSEMP